MRVSRLWGVVPAAVAALMALAPATAAAQRSAWRTRVAAVAAVRFDDNPFLLTTSRKADLDQPAAADVTSGRFTDMENATDLVAAPGVELRFAGPGIGGHDLDIEIAATYEANLANARRRHAEATLTVDQAIGADRLRLRSGLRPGYFSKNYLGDAIDGNLDNEITDDERRYAAGVSTEIDVWVSYRHRFSKAGKRRPVGVAVEVGAGYLDRAFRAPFPGRSRSGPGAAAGLALEGRRWSVDLDYEFASLQSDPTREVQLLDETAFGQDFNGSGSATQLSARAFELVDRSRTEHEIDLTLQGELAKQVTGELAYGRRMRSFSSTQPFDVAGRGREDTQNEIAAAVDVAVSKQLDLDFRARRVWQRTNRPTDPGATGEVADYTRHVVGAALRYRF